MEAPVNPATFVDPVIVFGTGVIVPGRRFDQRDLVGRVAVDLVRAYMDEHGFRRMLPGRLQQVYGPHSVHIEIYERDSGGFVVRRLSRAMYDQIKTMVFEEPENRIPVADINVVMRELLRDRLQPFAVPGRVTLWPEEFLPQVVVNTKDRVTLPVIVFNCSRANQPAASCY